MAKGCRWGLHPVKKYILELKLLGVTCQQQQNTRQGYPPQLDGLRLSIPELVSAIEVDGVRPRTLEGMR